MHRTASLPVFALLLASACLPAATSCSLPVVEGQVRDHDTAAPIADALVVEQWRGAGWMGEPQRTLDARFATTGTDGRFRFEASRASKLGSALRQRYGPVYLFVHPQYGLVRSGEAPGAGEPLVLEGSLADVASQRALAALCESPTREEWERVVVERACPGRSKRPPARDR
jgi:hypothetical protein